MRARIGLVSSLAILLVAPLAFAQKPAPFPKDLPPYGGIKPYVAPQVTQDKLPNGLIIWMVPRPGFPKVSFVLAVKGGMASDPAGLPGFSQLLATTLTQGTKTLSAKDIAQQIEAAGGDISARATADDLVVSTEVLSEKTQAALALLGDVAQNANFPADEVDLAKRNAAEELQGAEAQPSFLARRALAKAIFGSHPYSVISLTAESITKVTPELLRQEFARRFRPDQAILIAVGDFEAKAMKSQVSSAFGSWAAPSQPPVPAVAAPAQSNAHTIFMVPRPGSVQTTFVMGTFGPTERDPDYAAAEVANAIYGGMFSSRLISNIREDKGYTYSPGSFLQERSAVGLLETQADVRNAVTGASFNEIQYELNRMATTVPTPDEISRAQRYLSGIQSIAMQSESAVAGRLASLWMDGLQPDALTQMSADILKVTSQDVANVGAKYCPAIRETIVVVGEPSVIQTQLAPFGVPIQTVR